MFRLKKFSSPPAVNRAGYFWFLNDRMEDDELRRQLRSMAANGVGAVCPHPVPKEFRNYFMSDMQPPYLSSAFFDKIKLIADECADLGMVCYLYDEGGWPSGGACGKVWAADPERFNRRYLTLDGPDHYKVMKTNETPETRSPVPDLLQHAATDLFLKLTHEEYKKKVGDFFGNVYMFTFMDEPATPPVQERQLPWTPDMFAEFKKRKNYDVEPFIVPMLRRSLRPEAVQARLDYMDVVSQLFCENFIQPVRDWCRENKLILTGHFSTEDDPDKLETCDYGGYIMRALRALDMPGVDVIWRQLWPGVRLHPFPKFASSAARQIGMPYVMGEMFGVYGMGLSPEKMRFLLDYMVLCGVNMFVYGSYAYSTSGGRIEGARPYFNDANTLWPHLKELHEYTGRISYISVNTHPAADTALFFDTLSLLQPWELIKNFAFEQDKIAYRLLEQQSDFDYIDDDMLAQAVMRRGKLRVDKAEYSRLVIPAYCRMSPAARTNLERLKKQGLQVLNSDQSSQVPSTIRLEMPDWRLRVRKMALPKSDSVIYMLLNCTTERITNTFAVPEKTCVARLDAETGKLVQIPHTPGRWQWEFAPLESAFFLIGKEAEAAEPPPPAPGETVKKLSGKWSLTPVKQISVGQDDYITTRPDKPALKTDLGDWQDLLGSDFSGEAVYEKDFMVSDKTEIHFLDLGDVKTVAEVMLNGVALGKRLYPPYIFNVRNVLKKGRNTLQITVTNTTANAIHPDEIYQKWKKELPFMISYEERQRFFELDDLASGLMGPVCLRKKK